MTTKALTTSGFASTASTASEGVAVTRSTPSTPHQNSSGSAGSTTGPGAKLGPNISVNLVHHHLHPNVSPKLNSFKTWKV